MRQPEVICTPTPSASAARAAFWIAASNAGSSQAITGLVASNGEMVCPSGRYPPMVSVAAGPIENACIVGGGRLLGGGGGERPTARGRSGRRRRVRRRASSEQQHEPDARDREYPQRHTGNNMAGSRCGPATAGRAHSPSGRRGAIGAGGNGCDGFERRIDLAAEVHGACVLLIDGLGAELLDAYADDAPVMAELRGPTLQAGFPSTTVAGLAAVGTGCRSGEHGMVGLSFRLPGRRGDQPAAVAPPPVGRRSSRSRAARGGAADGDDIRTGGVRQASR